jgi:exodeoxyribonuclease-3
MVSTLGSPDVLCLQEIRLREVDEAQLAAMANALPSYDCAWALARDPKNVTFRGGRMYGVATFTKKALRAESRGFPWDREGRALVSFVAGLAIVNVYAVNGTPKPYWDHDLERFEGDRHAWKRRFLARLAEECAALGRPLVLTGDWNVTRTKLDTFPRLRTEEPHALARAQLNDAFMPGLDVVDVWRELHPEERKYSWFNRVAVARGRLDAARVDYVLLSRSLLPDARAADVLEDPKLRGRSDHAPLTLSLRLRGARAPQRRSRAPRGARGAARR